MDINVLILLVLIVVILLLLVVIGIMAFVLFQKIKAPEHQSLKEVEKPFGPDDFKKIFEDSKKQSEPILGLCSICEKELTKNDHFEIDNLHFCKEHFQTYTDKKWVAITNQLTTANTPEAGVYIYNFKKNLWEKEKIPTYIQCEYKIDVINDQIETYVQLHVVEEQAEILKNRIQVQKSE